MVNNPHQEEEDFLVKRAEDFLEELKQQQHQQFLHLVEEGQHLVKELPQVVDFLEDQKQYLHSELELEVSEEHKLKLLQSEEVYLVQNQQHQEEDSLVNHQRMLEQEEEVYLDQQLQLNLQQQEDYLELELNSQQQVEVCLEQSLQVHLHSLEQLNPLSQQQVVDYLELNHQQLEDFLEHHHLKRLHLEQNLQEDFLEEQLLNPQEVSLEEHHPNHQEVYLEERHSLKHQLQAYSEVNSHRHNKFLFSNTSIN